MKSLLINCIVVFLFSGCFESKTKELSQSDLDEMDPTPEMIIVSENPNIQQNTKLPTGDLNTSARLNIHKAWLEINKKSCPESIAFDYDISTKVGALLLYCYMSSVIDIKMLEKLAGKKVFLSGPHSNQSLSLSDPNSFGHYNPNFVNWFISNALPLNEFSNNITAQKIYKKYLSHLIPIYFAVKLKLNANPKFYNKEAKFINKFPHSQSYPDSPLYKYSNFVVINGGPDYSETFVGEATTFWLRRKIDGTHKLFEDAVVKFLKVWDLKSYKVLKKNNWAITK